MRVGIVDGAKSDGPNPVLILDSSLQDDWERDNLFFCPSLSLQETWSPGVWKTRVDDAEWYLGNERFGYEKMKDLDLCIFCTR